jgi:RNA-binding protein
MTDADLRRRAHGLDVTLWVGKGGLDPAVDELDDQLSNAGLVKIRFLRASLGGTTVDEAAAELAERVDAALVDTRGKTAVVHR